jgi:DNA mismatch repair protein MSH6
MQTKERDLYEFGMCLIDTSIGKFVVGQWLDDRCLSSLRTLLANCPPTELLLDRRTVGKHTLNVLNNSAPDALINYRSSPDKFWTASETLKYLIEGDFFRPEKDDFAEEDEQADEQDNSPRLHPTLRSMTDPADVLNLTPLPAYELALSSFGAVTSYLKECLIDEELLSLGLIDEYKDSRSLDALHSAGGGGEELRLLLDSVALKNLEVFENSSGGLQGTLLNSIDFCYTKFGKRRLRSWCCAPLCNVSAIQRRQDAIENLLELELADVRSIMKGFPDLERSLSKMHSQASSRRNKSHPDAKAIMFDANVYNKRKILDFLSLLEAFRKSQQLIQKLRNQKSQITSKLLSDIITEPANGGLFPEMDNILNFFDRAFDHQVARAKGQIIPKAGVNVPYEKASKAIDELKVEMNEYLRQQCRKFGSAIKYVNQVKLPFQLEFPEAVAKRADAEYELQSSRKGFQRFYTPFIRQQIEKLKKLEERKENALHESMRLVFARFDKHFNVFSQAIGCLALLDCLLSFAQFARTLQQKIGADQVCRPEFVDGQEGPVLELKDARHPTLISLCDNFVQNDLTLDRQMLLLTGPNMGGKSTLMRQTGLIVLLAQLGSLVPASLCRLSPVDRVFTRLGASDRILQGESTFYVELSEAATVLNHATESSLVLLDELGRGTGTWDGCSVAAAVARHLTDRVRCRCIFSTHYHQLVTRLQSEQKVLCRHMDCVVDCDQDDELAVPTLVFKYQLADGACPDSHGFHAAQMASIPQHVVKRALQYAKQAERQVLIRRLCSKLVKDNLQISELRTLFSTVSVA